MKLMMDSRKGKLGDTQILLPSGADDVTQEVHDVMTKPARTWLPCAVMTTLCCFTPFGIIALIFACDADFENKMGNFRVAHKAARRAKLLTLLSLISGLVCFALLLLYVYFLYRVVEKMAAGGGMMNLAPQGDMDAMMGAQRFGNE